MNQIVIFNNPAFNSDVRVITKNNEPYFIAKDVCAFFADALIAAERILKGGS